MTEDTDPHGVCDLPVTVRRIHEKLVNRYCDWRLAVAGLACVLSWGHRSQSVGKDSNSIERRKNASHRKKKKQARARKTLWTADVMCGSGEAARLTQRNRVESTQKKSELSPP